MQLIKVLLLLATGLVSTDALGKCKCMNESLSETISLTKAKIISSERVKVPAGFFDADTNYGCALLSFVIDKNGRATQIKLVESYPNRSVAANARDALKKYKFSPGISATNAALLFEVNAIE